jgi:hypothetical protein
VHGVSSSQPFLCLHVHHYALGRQLRLDTAVGEERDRERWRYDNLDRVRAWKIRIKEKEIWPNE